MELVKKILKTLSDYQLYAKLLKFIICIKSLKFYRDIVENYTSKSVASKVKIINKWQIPKTIYKVQQSLRLASYYWQFVKKVVCITRFLFDILKEINVEI